MEEIIIKENLPSAEDASCSSLISTTLPRKRLKAPKPSITEANQKRHKKFKSTRKLRTGKSYRNVRSHTSTRSVKRDIENKKMKDKAFFKGILCGSFFGASISSIMINIILKALKK